VFWCSAFAGWRDRAFRDKDVSFDSAFDSECRDWCESLAFAVNFAFDGEARSFVDTLGHGHHGSGHTRYGFRDWHRPWSNPGERIQALTLHIRLLEKWTGKLHAKFRDEDEAVFSILDYMFANGGGSALYSIQLACELETPVFKWLVHGLQSDNLVEQVGAELTLTDAGLVWRKRLLPKVTLNIDDLSDTDLGLKVNTWVGIFGIIITIAGIVVTIAVL